MAIFNAVFFPCDSFNLCFLPLQYDRERGRYNEGMEAAGALLDLAAIEHSQGGSPEAFLPWSLGSSAIEYVVSIAQLLSMHLNMLTELPAKITWAKEHLSQAKVRRLDAFFRAATEHQRMPGLGTRENPIASAYKTKNKIAFQFRCPPKFYVHNKVVIG